MKKSFLALIFMSTVLVGCGEISDKALKAAAKAILEEEKPNSGDNIAYESATSSQHLQEVAQTPEVVKPRPQAQSTSNYRESQTNYYAQAVSRSGGNVLVRRAPSLNAGRVTHLAFGEGVTVIAETNKCQTINGYYNCWKKIVDGAGYSGYVFGAYLE